MADILCLAVNRIKGIKGEDSKRLVLEFNHEEDLRRLGKAELEQFTGHSIKGELNWNETFAQAETDLKISAKSGIKIITIRDEKYPGLLKEIFDPPVVLFYRGDFPKPDPFLVALVGTRKPSSAAAKQAYILGKELGQLGISVVSGFAKGIDALSHRGNIEGGGATAAVLGSAVDMIYPLGNRTLARRILETGGCMLSEYPPGTGPMRWHFPARNRIISAFCKGTVIVEAPAKSGALITAGFALEQDRDLMVASCGVKSRNGEGTARLAQEGAKIVESGKDIIDAINNEL